MLSTLCAKESIFADNTVIVSTSCTLAVLVYDSIDAHIAVVVATLLNNSKPYIITNVYPYGAVVINHESKGTFKVNGQRLKAYWSRRFFKEKSTIHLATSD
ncbi:Uncharacterized protein Adt_27777 [Abeliophyllum distichum]|uniref:Uncharacterized protein n=1 Tax=Abeliophyllum distichum TaxID=126358 RepID=A0ABD1RVV5_9LAMI